MPRHSPTRAIAPRLRLIASAATVVGLFTVMIMSSAVQGVPQIRPGGPLPAPEVEPPPTVPSSTSPLGFDEQDRADPVVLQTLGVILSIIFAAGLLFVAVLIARALMRAWQDRALGLREAGDVGAAGSDGAHAPESSVKPESVRRGIDGALHSLSARPLPSDAIIAAWVGLEESAADAGLDRSASETASEFAVRIITSREGLTDETRTLVQLYERVRYGAYLADESDRERARLALRRIEEEWR